MSGRATPLALFRCDASPAIGAGHVSRCLALGEALAEAGWRIGFIVSAETPAAMPELKTAGFAIREVLDADDEVAAIAAEAGAVADLIVIDHYGRDLQFERACRPFARKILVFDDMTGRQHDCDLLLDSAAAGAQAYKGFLPAGARLLAGLSFALTRKAFLAARPTALARRDGRPVRNILVSCGAIDPLNVTATALEALASLASPIAVTVVLSSKAPHVTAIRKGLRPHECLLTDVSDMAALISDADLAIGTPGVTAYERALLGLPSVVTTIADNQRGVARVLADTGAASDAGVVDAGLKARIRTAVETLMASPDARLNMSRAAARLLDGRGPTRVMLACLGDAALKDGEQIRLRLADEGDEGWLLELQQRPETRRFFRNPGAPSPEGHHRWMEKTLGDATKLLLVIEVDGKPVGSLRLDRKSERRGQPCYEVSIAIDRCHSGRGIASLALAQARRLLPGASFEAEIAEGNLASQRAFKRAGYEPSGKNLYLCVSLAGLA